jgi:hypothetical protein
MAFKSATDAIRVANNRRTSGPCGMVKTIKEDWTGFINRWQTAAKLEDTLARSLAGMGTPVSYTEAARQVQTNLSTLNGEFNSISNKCKSLMMPDGRSVDSSKVPANEITTDFDPYNPQDLFNFNPSTTADEPGYQIPLPPAPASTKPVDTSGTVKPGGVVPKGVDPVEVKKAQVAQAGGAGMLLLAGAGIALMWLMGRNEKK